MLQVFLIKVYASNDKKKSWSVKKRYSEFSQLKNLLKRQYPSISIENFPPKNIFSNNFAPNFLQERRKRLQVFLNSILENIQTQNSDLLHRFLAEEHSFTLHKQIDNGDKENILNENTLKVSKLQDTFWETIINLQKENAMLKQQKLIILNLLIKHL